MLAGSLSTGFPRSAPRSRATVGRTEPVAEHPAGAELPVAAPSPPRPFPTSLSPPPPPASFGCSDRSDAARTAISGYGPNPEVRGPGGQPEARRPGNFCLFSATSDAPLRSPQVYGEQRREPRGAGRCLRCSWAARWGGAESGAGSVLFAVGISKEWASAISGGVDTFMGL